MIVSLQLTALDLLLLLGASFVVSSSVTPIMRTLALKKGIIDKPNEIHKTHAKPVPYLGGLAIVLATILVTYGSSLLTNFTRQSFFLASTILLPALCMAIIGLIDDIKKLKPWPRFVAQNTLAIIVALSLISTNTLGSPTGISLLDFGITLIWLVGITNAINFFDNIDGGASGAVAIIAAALTLIAFQNGQVLISAMASVLVGSTIGFLVWNRPPARIYMGDAGALFLGTLIASLTIRVDSNDVIGYFGLFIPLLLLAIPILDTSVAVLNRMRRGISPFQGGKDHLSHRIIRLGVDRKFTVVILWCLTFTFSLLAVLAHTYYDSIGHTILVLASLLWLACFTFFMLRSDN